MSLHCRRITFRVLAFFAVCALSACGGDDGAVDPSNASAADLEGYWINESEDQLGTSTRNGFGFVNTTRAPLVLPYSADDPMSVAYLGFPYSGFSDQQYASYTVDNGRIHQTVIADVAAVPGTEYSTRILSITPGGSLTLESDADPSGQRTYTWHARCPVGNAAGWQQYRGHVQDCPPAIPLGNSLAFDEHGDLHAVHGIGTAAYCEVPTYAYITETCIPRHVQLPMFRWSDVNVSNGIVRVALTLIDESVVILQRDLSTPDFDQPRVIDAMPGTAHQVRFVVGAELPTLQWRGTTTGLDVVTHSYTLGSDDTTWSKLSNDAMRYPFGATIGPDGDVYFVRDDAVHHVSQAGTAIGEPTALPNTGRGVITPPHVTPSGHIQLVYETRDIGTNPGGVGGMVIGNEAYFAEWNGTAWESTLLGNSYGAWIVTHGDEPARVVVAGQKATIPQLIMHTIEDGEVVDSELTTGEPAFGGGVTPEYLHTPSAIVSNDGDVATSFEGTTVFIRRAAPLQRQASTVSVTFLGVEAGARIFSDDGRVDCTGDCTFDAVVGERILLNLQLPPGWVGDIDCPDFLVYGGTRCRFPILDTNETITVRSFRSALDRTLSIGNERGTAVATAFDARGDKLVLQAEFNPGIVTFQVGGTTLTLPSAVPRALVGFDRVTRDAWITPIPTAVLAIAAASDGGAWMVTPITGVERFGDTNVGAVAEISLVRVRYDAEGSVVSAEAIAGGVSGDFSVTIADVDDDGTTVAATRENSMWRFVRAASTGTATETTLTASGSAREIVIDGTRSLISFDSQLITLDNTTVTGSRTLANGMLRDIALHGTRVVAIVTPLGSVDLGGAECSGVVCIVQYDQQLDHVAHATPATSGPGIGGGTTLALAAIADGTIVAIGNSVWMYDENLVLSVDPIDHTLTMVLASGQDDDSLMLLDVSTLIELRPE